MQMKMPRKYSKFMLTSYIIKADGILCYEIIKLIRNVKLFFSNF
jgi:hypothetical protein